MPSSAAANRGARLSPPSLSPAPTASRPIGNAATPMRCSVVATASGNFKPAALASKPATVLMIKGLRANSRR